ncbi:MAG: radical SAM protein [Desulfobacteraceae bacterium]|nr:radical SAM protein [Desulfobacteraceae bacterium]
MKIMLVLPPSNFISQAYGVKQKIRFGHTPPLGIGYIASYLEEDDHNVSILDASAMELSIDQTVQNISEFAPDVVGLSVLTNYSEFANELSSAIKAKLSGVTILLGGPHATYFYNEILDAMPGVDHVLYGEVDTSIKKYFRALKDPEKLSQLNGLCYRSKTGQVIINDPPELLDDLDKIPMPAWHLYDFTLYRPLPLQYKNYPYFTLITSRGCVWRKCKFCFQAGYCAPKFRRQSPERVVREMEILQNKYGVNEVNFWDDTFLLNKKWLIEFTSLLKEKKLKFTWTASGRVNHVDEEMLKMVYDAGCWSIFVGIESGNQDLLDEIKKGITLQQARDALAAANRIGLETRAAFILGLPSETPEKAKKTINFAIEIEPMYAVFYAAHPRYGTEFYDIATQHGTFLSKSFKGMSNITYVPEGYLDAKELDGIIRLAYRRFYLRPKTILKFIRKMKSFRDISELLKGFLLFLGLSKLGRSK